MESSFVLWSPDEITVLLTLVKGVGRLLRRSARSRIQGTIGGSSDDTSSLLTESEKEWRRN